MILIVLLAVPLTIFAQDTTNVYKVDKSKCIGCTICAQKCPVNAISIMPYQKHIINQDLCIKCGTCKQVCPTESVVIV